MFYLKLNDLVVYLNIIKYDLIKITIRIRTKKVNSNFKLYVVCF